MRASVRFFFSADRDERRAYWCTATMTAPVLELTGVTKAYGALRPLRIERLVLAPGDQLALLGLDQPAAEVLINLVTGASLPDTGEVRVFGRRTADITETDDWLTFLDRFGIVSDRAALLEPMTVLQNMAVPFSLQIEPPSPEVAEQPASDATPLAVPPPVRPGSGQSVPDLPGVLPEHLWPPLPTRRAPVPVVPDPVPALERRVRLTAEQAAT